MRSLEGREIQATWRVAKMLDRAVEVDTNKVVPLIPQIGLMEVNGVVKFAPFDFLRKISKEKSGEGGPQVHIKAYSALELKAETEPKLAKFLNETGAFITAPIPQVGQENFAGEHTDDQPEGANVEHFTQGYIKENSNNSL